jgi:hypothetical protein
MIALSSPLLFTNELRTRAIILLSKSEQIRAEDQYMQNY